MDPLKNIEEALSPVTIESVWDWYTSTHLSRLETGCPEIHIATRWSKKDPIGRLTDEYSVNYMADMEVICISALDENGESFCKEIKTTAEYMDIKKATNDFIWEAEFMQNPVDVKGLLLPPESLNYFSMNEIATKKPDGKIGYTDVADKGKDFLSSICGEIYGTNVYITDVVFTQDGVEITEPLVAEMIIRNNMNQMVIEANNGGDSFKRNVRDLVMPYCNCTITSETATQNKETRILMAKGDILRRFYFRNDYEPGSDYDVFMRQLTSYSRLGKNEHDDAIDSVTGLSNYTFSIVPQEPKKEENKIPWALQTDDDDFNMEVDSYAW